MLLGAPFLAFEIAEQVGVGDVRFVGRVIKPFVEYALELVHKGFFASHQAGQPGNVVGDIEGVVPGIAFVEAGTRLKVCALHRVEGGIKRAVREFRSEHFVFRAEIMAVT